jgi:hypothetical protein
VKARRAALSIAGDDPRFLAEIDRMQGAIAEGGRR